MTMSQEESHLVSLEGLKMKGGGSRRWIVMDASGQEKILDLEKYAIMDRVHIHARDLRILDPVLSYPSAIFGRDRAIVLNLEVNCCKFNKLFDRLFKEILSFGSRPYLGIGC